MNNGALGIPKRPDPQFRGSVDLTMPLNGSNQVIDPGPHNIVRIHSSTATQVFGIKGGVDGRILVFHFVEGGSTVTFMHENASAQPNERIISPYGSDFKSQATTNSGVTMSQATVLMYDATVSRWKPLHPVFDEGNPSGVSGTVGPGAGVSQAMSHSDHIHLLAAHKPALHNLVGFKVNDGASTQNIAAAGTDVTITWATEEWDTDACFASNTFTVPTGMSGYWRFDASLEYDGTSTHNNRFNVVLRKNGTTNVFSYRNILHAVTGGAHFQIPSTMLSLVAGDTIVLAGTSPDEAVVIKGTAIQSYFQGQYMGF